MKFILWFVFILMVHLNADPLTNTPLKDPFADVTANPYAYTEEYPFLNQERILETYRVISWHDIFSLQQEKLIEGQIDGFLKVYSEKIEEGANKGEIAYRYVLYRSMEDLKYKRLGSCIILSSYTVEPLQTNLVKKDPDLLNEKYCVASGVFRRERGTRSSIATTIQLNQLIFKKDEDRKTGVEK